MKLGPSLVLAVLVGALLGAPRVASAALTTSERGQVRDFVARGKVESAAKVRALVARTDLSVEESTAAMVDALSPVTFDEARANFVRELVFGAASAPSRPLVAQIVTRGLLARADAIYQRYVGGLDHEPRALAELWAIYAFLDADVANAGRPTFAAHDASAGVPSATYEACGKALREHVERNARWLKGDGAIAEAAARVRAQAQLALIDMLPDGLTRRVDAADQLGLGAARRKMLGEWGVLLADAGKLGEAEAERVRDVLAKLPGARVDLSVLWASADRGPLRARGQVARVGAPGADEYPFADLVTGGPHDPATSAIALDLSVLAAKRALDNRGELRLVAERDAAAAQGSRDRLLGRPRAPSVDHVIGAAVHLLVLDAPRAIDLAGLRFVAGRPESAALLSDAMGALAAFATPDPSGGGAELPFAKAIRLAPSGAAVGFTEGGRAWSLEREAPSFAVTAIRRDGKPVTAATFATARAPGPAAAK